LYNSIVWSFIYHHHGRSLIGSNHSFSSHFSVYKKPAATKMSSTIENDTHVPSQHESEATLSLLSAISLLIISVITVVGNGILCVAMYKDPLKCFRSSPMLFVANLAVADFLTGFIVDPLYIAYNFGYYQARDYQTALTAGDHASYITVNLSLCTVVVLVVDRFLALNTPIRYRNVMTRRVAGGTIAVLWVYSVLFSFLRNIGVPENTYYLLDLHIHVTGSLVTLTVFLVLIYRRSVVARNQRVDLADSTSRFDEQRKQMIGDAKIIRTFLIILAACYLCLLPYYIYMHVYLFCATCQTNIVLTAMSKISEPVVYLNCAVNPFIYAWRHKMFRNSLRAVVMKQNTVNQEVIISQRTGTSQLCEMQNT